LRERATDMHEADMVSHLSQGLLAFDVSRCVASNVGFSRVGSQEIDFDLGE